MCEIIMHHLRVALSEQLRHPKRHLLWSCCCLLSVVLCHPDGHVQHYEDRSKWSTALSLLPPTLLFFLTREDVFNESHLPLDLARLMTPDSSSWDVYLKSNRRKFTTLLSPKTVMITFTPDTCLKLFSDSHKFGSKLVCLVQPYANFFQILIIISWKCFRRAFQRYKEHLSHLFSSYTFT